MLVVGETGSGKSTFINLLENYYHSGDPDHLKVAIPTKYLRSTEQYSHSEDNVKDTASSKTSLCSSYKFGNSEFIDTPGISDTRGIDKDNENIIQILEYAANTESLNGMILVINGTNSRLTINMKNVITRLYGNLPNDMKDNILVVLTNCWEYNCNFDVSHLPFTPQQVYYMNNSIFSGDPRKWKNDPFVKNTLTKEFERSKNVVHDIVSFSNMLNPISTKSFKDILKLRFIIKKELHEARLNIVKLQKIQDEMIIAENMIEKYGAEAKKNEDFVQKKKITTTVCVSVDHLNTLCENCSEVCHEKCSLEEISTKGDNAFIYCTAMGGNSLNYITGNAFCTVCTGKCHYSHHYHARKKFVKKQQIIEEIFEEMKSKYEENLKQKKETIGELNAQEERKILMNLAIKDYIKTVVAKCKELKKICSGFNFAVELQTMIDLLEMEKQSLSSHETINTANELINSIKAISDSLSQKKEPIHEGTKEIQKLNVYSSNVHKLSKFAEKGIVVSLFKQKNLPEKTPKISKSNFSSDRLHQLYQFTTKGVFSLVPHLKSNK
uniref:G domain-containing protein n=1 Tax=Arcella intermedia TaxID=1963864 RepID=A0A6B2L0W1_9EUKA